MDTVITKTKGLLCAIIALTTCILSLVTFPAYADEPSPPVEEEITDQADILEPKATAETIPNDANTTKLSAIELTVKIPMSIELEQDGDSATGTYEIYVKGGNLQPGESVTITLQNKALDFENISDDSVAPIRGTITQEKTTVYAEEITDEYPATGQISGTIAVSGLTTGDWKSQAIFELNVEGPTQEEPEAPTESATPTDESNIVDSPENQDSPNPESTDKNEAVTPEPEIPEPTPSEPTTSEPAESEPPVTEIPPASELPEENASLPVTSESPVPEITEPVETAPVETSPPIEDSIESFIDSPSPEGAVFIISTASAILSCIKYVS